MVDNTFEEGQRLSVTGRIVLRLQENSLQLGGEKKDEVSKHLLRRDVHSGTQKPLPLTLSSHQACPLSEFQFREQLNCPSSYLLFPNQTDTNPQPACFDALGFSFPLKPSRSRAGAPRLPLLGLCGFLTYSESLAFSHPRLQAAADISSWPSLLFHLNSDKMILKCLSPF